MIHISDAHDLDQQTSITVDDNMDVGRAAKIALDDLVDKFGYNVEFPIFMEIHPYASFGNVEWMHKEAETPEPVIIKNSTSAPPPIVAPMADLLR